MKTNLTYRLLLVTAALLLSIAAAAVPARHREIVLQQPDGTCFLALMQGDEFIRIRTTVRGEAIIQEADGWWCHAIFNEDGSRYSSGYRVGTDAPQSVMDDSRRIPFARLRELAVQRRSHVGNTGTEAQPLLKRLRRTTVATRAEDNPETTLKHGLVILAQFSDVKFRHSREDFTNMLTLKGYNVNGATGCAKEYFDAQFHGAFDFSFEVSEIVTVSKNRAYYGGNDADGVDKAPAELIAEACRLADASTDFSLYDDDGDGAVDNIFVFFAGGDEAEGDAEECIWSHAWNVYNGAGIRLELDGMLIDRYACSSELARIYTGATSFKENLSGIGTFCHEYSHTFGLPDLYDTDYDQGGGWAAGLWTSTALMDGGNYNNHGNTPPYFNAIERECLGISEPTLIEADGSYTLEPIHLSGQYFKMAGDKDGEYYLFECRAATGWDSYIGGSGMLVYHIDKSGSYERRWADNIVNADHSHQCADLIEADGRSDRHVDGQPDLKGIFFPYEGMTSFTYETTPAISWWSGWQGKLTLTNIRRDGENITFSVIGGSETTTPPEPEGITYEAFADAVIIGFRSSRSYTGEATVEWGLTGKETQRTQVKPYGDGLYSVTLEGLEPGSRTYTVTISFEIDGVSGEPRSFSFMTRKKSSISWPFIYLSGVTRNSDGTFPPGCRLPLRVYNAADAAMVEWFFDGSPAIPSGDGYWYPQQSGELKAVVSWEDGSTDTMIKNIILSDRQ